MLRRILPFIIILSLSISAIGCESVVTKESSPAHKLLAGQVWKYKNRPGEDDSVIRILKIEYYDIVGTVVHISVENLKLTNADDKSVNFSVIDHMVFNQKAIEDSVTELVKEKDELPDFQISYENWKKSFNQGQAGICDVSVAYSISVLEEIMN